MPTKSQAAQLILDVLPGLGPLAACSPGRIARINPPPELLDVLPGEAIVREGRYDHEWYVILEGTAVAIQGTTELGRLGPGEHFGEIALLSNRPRRVTMRAETPMRILMLSGQAFLSLLGDCAPFTYAVLNCLVERTASPLWPNAVARPTVAVPRPTGPRRAQPSQST